MPKTGSRRAIPLLVTGAILLALLGLVTALAGQVQAGAADTVVVNSTGDDDDGDCEGPPNNNVIGGDCTLREAIEAVNDGDADVIAFHPPVFPKENPGVINIEDADGTLGPEGCLPEIERNGVTVDSQNSGVVIDGDRDADGSPQTCDAALEADATSNGFDFTILGGKNLTIRQWDGDGIDVDADDFSGDTFSFGDVEISGLIIEDVTGNGIKIEDTREVHNLVITNNDITAEYPEVGSDTGDDGIEVDVDHVSCGGCTGSDVYVFDDDQVVDITDNQIFGQGGGVDLDFTGDLGFPDTGRTNKITINVSENESIDVDEDGHEAVQFDLDGCIFKSAVNIDVNGNGRLTSGVQDGVSVDIQGGDGDCQLIDDSQRAAVDVSVSDNGVIEVLDGPGDDSGEGVDLQLDLCCGGSEHNVTTVVDGNDDIIGADDGVQIQYRICCGDENTSSVSVSGNGEITGEDGRGVDIRPQVGDPGAGEDSDGNSSTVLVNDNDEITGVSNHGVDVFTQVGAFGGALGSGDDNQSVTEIMGNRRIDGDSRGIDFYAFAGSRAEADENTVMVTVAENEQVDGGTDDGAFIQAQAGSESFFGSSAFEGDDNETNVIVEGNDRFSGNDGDGVHVFAFAGGATSGSERNTTNTTITGNGDIEGEGDGFDGIHLNPLACCSARKSNVNNVTISDNVGDIIGHDDDGIGFDEHPEDGVADGICCTVSHNVVTITDNAGVIRGGDDAGIDYDVDLDAITGTTLDGVRGDLDTDQLFNTVNILTISGNTLDGSGRDGIEICCGAFEEASQGKSVISDNVIRHNADHGIEIDSSFGLNVGPNNIISLNGDDESVDAGIEIDNETTLSELRGSSFNVPANHNRITQNSIFDNTGLGIDLAGDPDDSDHQNTGPEDDAIDELTDSDDSDGNSEHDHGVGCLTKDEPISPNDCIPHPTLQTQAGNKLVGHSCSLCTVEVFWADPTPEDQTGGPDDQHEGEEHGEGVEYIVSGTAGADGDFSIQLPCGLGAGELTATATDKVKNTSEFAANQPTLGTSSCATPTFTPTNTVPPTNTPLPTNTPMPTNTPVPPPPPPPPPAKACGDVDDSGEVNSIDAQLVLQLKAGLLASLPNEASADVNGDGDITSVDALLILQLDAGLIEELNCG